MLARLLSKSLANSVRRVGSFRGASQTKPRTFIGIHSHCNSCSLRAVAVQFLSRGAKIQASRPCICVFLGSFKGRASHQEKRSDRHGGGRDGGDVLDLVVVMRLPTDLVQQCLWVISNVRIESKKLCTVSLACTYKIGVVYQIWMLIWLRPRRLLRLNTPAWSNQTWKQIDAASHAW